MSALVAADRDRLARLLGMLGSSFDGEVANAFCSVECTSARYLTS